MSTETRHWVALGFSPAARPILHQLDQAGLISAIRWPRGSAPETEPEEGDQRALAEWLTDAWPNAKAVLAVGACGLVTRLIAPLINHKDKDPAVLVIDPLGRFVIPLLGGHAGGGESFSQEVAALLGAQAVITGSSGSQKRLALDSFGTAWGWTRGEGDWRLLMQEASQGIIPGPVVHQDGGSQLWRNLNAASGLMPQADGSPNPTALIISPRRGPGCRWHPPCLWLGIGCERGTSLSVIERQVEHVLDDHGLALTAIAGLASIDRKGDEQALLDLSERHGWPLRLFNAEVLKDVPVPNPSVAVAREMGSASVAEAAARLAAGWRPKTPGAGELLVPKTIEGAMKHEQGAATLAIAQDSSQWAPARGALHLVGSGPGRIDLLSGDARKALATATAWLGYGLYLDLLEPLRRPDQLRCDGRLTEEKARCQQALELASQGLNVALISSGESGIYGMAGLALELWLQQPAAERPRFEVHPGLSALQLAAARVGAPLMHDFCTISLSDRLTPWEVIEQRLRAAASGDFVVALYNPRSLGREWQLGRARELLLEGKPPETPVALARQLGRSGEQVQLHSLGTMPIDLVDMLTLVLIGNRSTYVRDGRMVTPRGYPGADLN